VLAVTSIDDLIVYRDSRSFIDILEQEVRFYLTDLKKKETRIFIK